MTAAGMSHPADHVGVFDGHLRIGDRPALILIDVCDAYLLPDSPLYTPAFGLALPPIARLLGLARAANMPVIHTRVVYQTGGLDGGLFYRKIPALTAFDEGSPLGRFPAAALPAPGELVITKQYASAFSGTSLLSALNAQRIDSLLVCGFSTSGCVRATATDAIQLGIAPFVVREACADRNEAIQQANLFDLQAKYAEVIGIETVAGLIAGRAGQ